MVVEMFLQCGYQVGWDRYVAGTGVGLGCGDLVSAADTHDGALDADVAAPILWIGPPVDPLALRRAIWSLR